MVDIGMNLSGVSYWSAEHPFIDRFKTSAAWTAYQYSGATNQTVKVDANGYPTGMPAGADYLATAIDLDSASAGTNDRYVLTYTGTATFSIVGATIVSSKPGEVVFQYDGALDWATLTASKLDAANPLTAIHVVRQDQQALFAQGEIFNPEFIAKSSSWDTLRFKDWEATDNSSITAWSQRTTLASASWSSAAGVPIEVQVKLANETHTNMWVNIPEAASDDYVQQMLRYIHDNLDPALKVSVEYSNEMWNWGFEQSHYALTMGDKLWGTDANHDGVIDPNDPAEHVADGNLQYYGYRSAQIAAIAHTVFSDSASRLHDVLATQTAFTGLEQSILKGVAKAKAGTPGALFDGYAVTTYFGGELDGTTAADRAQVLAWARAGSAGVDAAFHEMEFGGAGLSASGSLADLATTLVYQSAIAKKNGMALVAYEGGAHLTATAYDAGVQGEITAFFDTLMNDKRMGDLYTKMAAIFNAAGGTDLTAFEDVAGSGVYGDWGMLGSVYDHGSPRYDALLAVQKQGQAAPIQTLLHSYTMDVADSALVFTGTGTFTAKGNDFDNVITGGAGTDTLYGYGGSDTLVGGAGNDRLDGGTGADRMIGGAGNDTYVVDNAGDVIVEKAGEGIDLVTTTLASYTLGDNLENLTHSRATAFVGTGNALDNVITGANGPNTLYGLGGNDTLIGGTGNDILDGGTGADRMTGGLGDDIYYVDHVGDVVVEAPGEGNDEVRTTLASYTLGDNVEKLTALGTAAFTGTGNALDNVITAGAGAAKLYGLDGNDTLVGGNGDDYLDGGTGADHMAGGAGNDTYVVDDSGDIVTELPGQGIDTVRTSLAFYILPSEVENLVSTVTTGLVAYGNASDNVITGSAVGADQLMGGDGNDTLIGGAGNDHLDGGAGADTMRGGAGDDEYYVDNPGDIVVEAPGGGNDRVYSSISYTLTANVETLIMTGSADTVSNGNALDNLLIANSGNSTLSGKGGNDQIIGGGGDDHLYGNDGDDQLYGAAGNDVLNGNDGNDVINGGDGNDVITGGTGRDAVYGGAGADRFVFKPGDLATVPAGGWVGSYADTIGDFSHADKDRIDLSAFDAKSGTAAADAFTFIGTGAFTHHAGELRIQAYGGAYDVMGDTNGDGIADFHLYVVSTTALVAADFVL